jgi:hypothetical protein
MRLLLLLLLIPLAGLTQQTSYNEFKPFKITGNDLLLICTQAIAGTADGLHELINTQRFKKGDPFWDERISWKNKYDDFDGGDKSAAFFGSKTIFVGFTDGYHLTNSINRLFTLAGIGIAGGELKCYDKKDRWKVVAKKIIISAIANRIAFNVVYHNVK